MASISGKFDFTVGIDDIDIVENLKKVFGIEGGKVKFTAGPKDTSAKAFFMKVKMTP